VQRGASLGHVLVDRAATQQLADDLIWGPTTLVARRPRGP